MLVVLAVEILEVLEELLVGVGVSAVVVGLVAFVVDVVLDVHLGRDGVLELDPLLSYLLNSIPFLPTDCISLASMCLASFYCVLVSYIILQLTV